MFLYSALIMRLMIAKFTSTEEGIVLPAVRLFICLSVNTFTATHRIFVKNSPECPPWYAVIRTDWASYRFVSRSSERSNNHEPLLTFENPSIRFAEQIRWKIPQSHCQNPPSSSFAVRPTCVEIRGHHLLFLQLGSGCSCVTETLCERIIVDF